VGNRENPVEQSATGILYVDFFTVVVGEVLAK